MNTNFKVIGLARLRIKPKSTAPEADALTTQPSERIQTVQFQMSRTRRSVNSLVKSQLDYANLI